MSTLKKGLILLLLFVPNLSYALLPNYCSRFQLPGWWGSGEYLLTWRKSRFYPPLVVIGEPEIIAFGNEDLNKSPRSGGRGDIGFWMLPCLGFGGGFFNLGQEKIGYSASSNAAGSPFIGRPFIDGGVPDIDPISFPLVARGTIDIDTTNRILGYDLYTRYRMLALPCAKFDLLAGFRYIQLDDDLRISTNSETILVGDSLSITDRFSMENDFYSGLVGCIGELRSQCWAVQITGKVGLGKMQRKANLTGETTVTTALGSLSTPEGLLIGETNRGFHSRNGFEIVPEINAQLQIRPWPHFWFTVGYQSMYWPKVFLSGEQVNLNINSTFPAKEKSFWVQGFTAGIYILY